MSKPSKSGGSGSPLRSTPTDLTSLVWWLRITPRSSDALRDDSGVMLSANSKPWIEISPTLNGSVDATRPVEGASWRPKIDSSAVWL